MAAKRFYYQWSIDDARWTVFDRRLVRGGGVTAIAICLIEEIAVKITDTLNEADELANERIVKKETLMTDRKDAAPGGDVKQWALDLATRVGWKNRDGMQVAGQRDIANALMYARREGERAGRALRVEVGEMRESSGRVRYYVMMYRPGDKPWDAMSLSECPTRKDADGEVEVWRRWLGALPIITTDKSCEAEETGAWSRGEAEPSVGRPGDDPATVNYLEVQRLRELLRIANEQLADLIRQRDAAIRERDEVRTDLNDRIVEMARDQDERTECNHGNVRYSQEHDNYYCGWCSAGMGRAYYAIAKRAESAERDATALRTAKDGAIVERDYYKKLTHDLSTGTAQGGTMQALAPHDRARAMIDAALTPIQHQTQIGDKND